MIELKNKKILLIAPRFFNYDIEIKKKLEAYGAFVTLFDDRPSNNSITKAIIRINRNLIKPLIENYYKQIIKKSGKRKYDIVFFNKGESATIKAMKRLKKYYGTAKFVLYLWDSVENNKNLLIFDFFDRVLSFDKMDCLKHKSFVFRPLFYLDYFKEIGASQDLSLKYDLSFVGTIHSDRYFILKEIINSCVKNKINAKIIMYLPSKLLFWYRKIFEKKFRNVPYSDIEFTTTSFTELMECFNLSKAIIDIEHPDQTGLTMRTIEALGARKKLITTNVTVKEYDFFNSNNICIIERNSPKIPQEFLLSNYHNLSDDIYRKYSIDGWVNDCLKDL